MERRRAKETSLGAKEQELDLREAALAKAVEAVEREKTAIASEKVALDRERKALARKQRDVEKLQLSVESEKEETRRCGVSLLFPAVFWLFYFCFPTGLMLKNDEFDRTKEELGSLRSAAEEMVSRTRTTKPKQIKLPSAT